MATTTAPSSRLPSCGEAYRVGARNTYPDDMDGPLRMGQARSKGHASCTMGCGVGDIRIDKRISNSSILFHLSKLLDNWLAQRFGSRATSNTGRLVKMRRNSGGLKCLLS